MPRGRKKQGEKQCWRAYGEDRCWNHTVRTRLNIQLGSSPAVHRSAYHRQFVPTSSYRIYIACAEECELYISHPKAPLVRDVVAHVSMHRLCDIYSLHLLESQHPASDRKALVEAEALKCNETRVVISINRRTTSEDVSHPDQLVLDIHLVLMLIMAPPYLLGPHHDAVSSNTVSGTWRVSD
ncbi:hypothetical protein BDQ17DRAFT_1425674 [Cyathus striatus]|nr:hypothetical protein BDQ17DRAFT_1425674 [Cyathus striatus]